MTTLAKNAVRNIETSGNRSHHPVIASDIIFAMAAVGLVTATGHARPLAAGDRFAGFAVSKLDNSAGSAADLNVQVYQKGIIELSVSGAVITDVGQPVYATDDDVFVFLPTGGVFIGLVARFVSAGKVTVRFDVDVLEDPYGGGVYETLSASTKVLDIQDTGKTFFVTVDDVITMPATALAAIFDVVCMGPYGTVQITMDCASGDKNFGPDFTSADDDNLINTKATAQRGDRVILEGGHADGYVVKSLKGVWANS